MAKRILLADDSITIQKVVELTFSDGDYQIVAANNGSKAIQKLAEWRPDIILSDIIMPEKNGYEVCEYVKSHPEYRDIPVILLTGTFEPFDPDRAEKAGCDAVVTKPFESQSLIHKVEELIAQRRSSPAPPQRSPELFTPSHEISSQEVSESSPATPIAGQTLPWRMPDFAQSPEVPIFQSEPPLQEERSPFSQTAPWQQRTDALSPENETGAEALESDPFLSSDASAEDIAAEFKPVLEESVFAGDTADLTSDGSVFSSEALQSTSPPRWELASPSTDPMTEYTGGDTQAFPSFNADEAGNGSQELEARPLSPHLEVDHNWGMDEPTPEPMAEASAETMGRTLPFPRIAEPDEDVTRDDSADQGEREDEVSRDFTGTDFGGEPLETSSRDEDALAGSDDISIVSTDESREPFASAGWSPALQDSLTRADERSADAEQPLDDSLPEELGEASPFTAESDSALPTDSDGPLADSSAEEPDLLGVVESQEYRGDEASVWEPAPEAVRDEEQGEPAQIWTSRDAFTESPVEESEAPAENDDRIEAPEETEDQIEMGQAAPMAPLLEPEPSTAGTEPEAAPGASGLSDGDVERIARRVVELMSEQTVKNIAWEVIPDMAEMIVRERIRELENQI